MPGLRWGLEGEVLFATGSNMEETYPDRAAVKPYTVGKNSYSARTMLTWDGLRAGSGVPLRLHANAAYTSQQDEGRFLIPRDRSLELGAPALARDNDFASLGAAVELDLSGSPFFGEIVTDQFVHERTLSKGKENRIAVTPGARLWLPGGISLMGAYSMSLSEDDEATAFIPDGGFPEAEWRVALSLGTVYRGARARAAEAAPLVVPAPVPAPAMAVVTEPAPPDSAALAKLRKEREIMERRDVQDEPRAAKPPAASPEAAGGPEVSAVTSPQALAPSGRLLDSDRDGFPTSRTSVRCSRRTSTGSRIATAAPNWTTTRTASRTSGTSVPTIRRPSTGTMTSTAVRTRHRSAGSARRPVA